VIAQAHDGWSNDIEPILPCCDPCPQLGDCDPVYCGKLHECLSDAESAEIEEVYGR